MASSDDNQSEKHDSGTSAASKSYISTAVEFVTKSGLSNSAINLSVVTKGSNWIIDSGATDHMTCDPHIFISFSSNCSKSVIINANGVSSPIEGIDNGGEYFKTELIEFMNSKGILHQTTCPYSPQQNGVAERKNRHILEVTRSLLIDGNVPSHLWGEALEERTIKCVFVGYGTTQKGYRAYHQPSKKFYISMDVTFNEHEFFYVDSPLQGGNESEVYNHDVSMFDYEDMLSCEDHSAASEPILNMETSFLDNTVFSDQNQLAQSSPQVQLDSSEVPSDPNSDNTNLDEIDSCLPETTSIPNTESPIVQYNLPPSSNRGQPPAKYEPDLQAKVKYPISKYVSSHRKKQHLGSCVLTKREENCGLQMADGTIERYKARLVAKGYTQSYGVDYQETFAPVAKLNTVRILLSLAANQDWPLLQFDVKNTFLHGEISEEIYMDSPPGMTDSNEMRVCKLKKALYGLKQSPRAWFGRFTKSMKAFGYRASNSDHTLFFKRGKGKITALIIYVDDMIVTGNDQDEISSLQQYLASEFKMKQLGNLKYFLGIELLLSVDRSVRSVRLFALCGLPVARFALVLFAGFACCAFTTQQLAPTVGQGFKNSQGAMATKFDVEKFNGANDFGLWKIKMEAILIQQGCDEALKGESRMSDAMTQEEKKKMGDKARSAIILCLGDKVLREVTKEKTAAEIWAKLESLYMTRSLAHRLCLKQQLFSFKMSESRMIEEQIAEFSKIVDDLENIEVKLEDEDKAVILLNALPITFEHFRDALLYGKDQVITLEEVVTSIRTKEFQKLQDSKTTEEGASGLISMKGKWKKQAGKEKKLNPDGTKQVRCFKCQKMGHIKKFCPEKGKAGRPQETADVAEASEGYESAGVLVASSEDPQRSWVMDSGCSYHMCPVKEFFENLDQKEHGNVLLGNNKACRVQGVGSVRLKMFDNREMVLQAVRYVPELKRNLISISSFDLGGYTTKVEDGVMKVCSGDSVVAKGRRRNDLYILEGSTVIGHVSVASGTENTARLWHLRMGHISEKGLEELEKQGLLLGDKLQKLDFCDHCVLGKSHRIPFGKGKHSTERPFEYVHADLWGPARTLTHGGGAYFLSIIDDFSRRVWIYVLKNKSETFQKFKEWHTQIENQLGCRLKCLRTDNGLEFVSEEFNGFCKEKGIRRHRTVVGTPQQNGLAERMNRTILERVRCMLLGSGLSKAFWGEATNTAVYLINRSPSSALNFKTPMEVWSGRPADYSHLRVFGSLAFAHVRGDKLDSRAAKCIFLGYAEGVKGYRLWRLDSPSKLIISRDVIFDETRMAMHPENSGSEKKILVEVEHTTNGAGTPGGTEENQTGEGRVENGRMIEENRSDEFRTDLGDDTDGMSGEGSHGKAAGVDLRNYQLVRDRERRISKPTKRFGEADLICYALNAAEDLNRSDEPRSYKEALDSSDRHLWQGAMEEELEALKKNSTWRLVDLPKGKKVIGSKWIFKKKEATPGGEKARYKARLVAKGFTQIEGVDYHEIFAPVVKHCSVRVLMAIVAHCNLHLEQLDVRTAFLHDDLEETIYMKQPDGFAVGDRVCLLQKSLYGLKQSPRQWYRKFDDFLIKLNFKQCNYDDCVYTLNHDGEMLYLLLYVDDILIASSDRGMIGETKARLADAFEMKELGEARRILGIDIKRDKPGGNLFLSQECYLQKVISRYRMAESKMASTPVGQHLKLTKEQCPKTEEERRKMESVPFSNGIGSIMYGMVCTRPDVAHGVSVLSQFMVNPGPTHSEALKWMLRYIRGSLGTGLSFQNNFQGGGYIEGFVDSDFAGCMDTRKSRSGYVFTLFGTAVSWRSTLQSVVALSTTEAEYYALAEGVKEALWLKGLVRELGFDQKSVCVHCDSQSAIHLANHQIYHSRTKHIDVKLHFVRSIVESGDVQICKIASEENPADMLTKPLAKERFLLLLSRIGCLPVGH
ncbi:hypothetical protein V8G54_003670 [Vigna mungo]|uniref:Uncharacterized protein n=1 Tax=Vigna mungo TaxID=3915 RepID=A0AAQ3SE28_VIGMU